MEVIQRSQLLDLHGRIDEYIHAPAAHLLQRLVTLAGAQHLDFHAQLASHLAQQIDIGADQVLRIFWVLPGIGRRIRATGRHQTLALACRHDQRRQHRHHARQRPARSAKRHPSLLASKKNPTLKARAGLLYK
ncbi:hypothetical protein D3C71_1711320 [compost metagenome]